MDNIAGTPYVAAFALGLGGGVTLERYRAPSGGLNKMRLVHHASKIWVEQEYAGNKIRDSLSIQNSLVEKLKAKLAEKGLSWHPTND